MLRENLANLWIKRPLLGALLACGLLLLAACRIAGAGGGPDSAPLAAVGASPTPAATSTSSATPEPPAAASPTQDPPSPTAAATSTSVPSATPTASPPPPTSTPLPSATPTSTPTATVRPPPLPEWLTYLNRFRAMAGLRPVLDWEPYNAGSEHHSYYMVTNDAAIAHSQDPDHPLFDPAGDQAARNGNIFATSQTDADYVWSLNFWASAPFHLIGMLDPRLNLVGYGDHVEESGEVNMAAVLDIGSDEGLDSGIAYPVLFPGPQSKTWVVRHSLYEWPDPLAGCPGYARPTGAPIVLFLGDGSGVPQVANHRLALGDQPLESCIFDESTYRNPDAYAEGVGRTILSLNDAVVIIPRTPLAADATYTAQVTADGQTFTWQFHTVKRPE